MIRLIELSGLFGRFEYELNLKQNGVTIITGPNGFGKSTILKIIKALWEEDVSFFQNLKFEKLVVSFEGENEYQAIIQKDGSELSVNSVKISKNVLKMIYHFNRRRIGYNQKHQIFTSIKSGFYIDGENNNSLKGIDRYYYTRYSKDDPETEKNLLELKNEFGIISSLCNEVRFITDQRLFRKETDGRDSEIIDIITELPSKLASEITKITEEYSRVSNDLDSTYPLRLILASEGLDNEEEYKKRLNEVNDKFEKLSNYGLAKKPELNQTNYDERYSTALKIYFDDFQKKYKVFKDLITKLDLFTSIINQRFNFKEIRVDSEKGFVVESLDKEKKSLDLRELSSGEKQEIVLFYNLIFKSKEKLLLLIDEPEISLHIAWQKVFLDDLQKVCNIVDLQVIVATHSPQIISNHLDLQIDLGEIYGSKLNNS